MSAQGTEPDPEKVKAVQDFPTPTSASGVRGVLGMASCYRRFVNNFAGIATPLHDLRKGQLEFCWSLQADKASTTLKHHLCSTPVLALPNFFIPFTIYTDASDVGLGAVLAQRIGREHVIAYASCTLTSAEKNYLTTEKECLAIVWSVNYWQTYLLGKSFDVVTDHQCLAWLQRLKEWKGRLARCPVLTGIPVPNKASPRKKKWECGCSLSFSSKDESGTSESVEEGRESFEFRTTQHQ